ncbi:hypothetical protein [Sunxiuqinia indica]|uniref:hypothetical protein n=1 Tax=Sunxiuqinia indica TaxID=2692584 RepID=UPI001357CB35|nr:hypothetical protein [Sunxiuqinia indica]
MTDVEILKQLFLEIGCSFSGCSTLIGSTVTIKPDDNREVDFEFDQSGKFLRII